MLACALALSSIDAAEHDVVARRQLGAEVGDRRRAICLTTVAASTPGTTSACTVTVGRRWRRQISGGSRP